MSSPAPRRFFWYGWPSWVVEILGGLVLASIAQVARAVLVQVAIGMVLSVGYEHLLDVNGWQARDVIQRTVGLLIGIAIWRLIRG